MTLEDFATAVHEDYLAIRKDMATKADLWPMQRDIKTLDTNVRELRSDVKMITDSMVSKADLSEAIRRELDASPFAKASEVKDLNERMLRVEEAVGIKPKRRGA
jgi:hypothetical protein